MVFKHSFGFKPGLRLGAGLGSHAHSEAGEFSSLPCHVQTDLARPKPGLQFPGEVDTEQNFDSLKCEGESGFRGKDYQDKLHNCLFHYRAETHQPIDAIQRRGDSYWSRYQQ